MALFSATYSGVPFALFSATHVLALAAVLACCLALAAALRWGPPGAGWRGALRHGLAIFTLLNFVAWYAWEWSVGALAWAYSLPIHICVLSMLLCPLMLWTRSQLLFEICYFWSFAGATQAMLTPDVAPFNFPHFVFVIFFSSHGALLLCVIYMLVAERFRPRWASLGRAVAATLVLLAVDGVANALTGGNYMYVARAPNFPSVIGYLGPWPWYLPPLILLGAAVMALTYLPFALHDWWRGRYTF